MGTVTSDSRKAGELAHAPRVAIEDLNQRIAKRQYMRDGVTTICILTMVNGFKVIGHSTPASAANFREDLGMEFALEHALRQAWAFEGYLLKERLSNPVFATDA